MLMFGHKVDLLARGDPGWAWHQRHKLPPAAQAGNHNVKMHKLTILIVLRFKDHKSKGR